MKRPVSLISLTFIVASLVLSLTSCGNHTHDYGDWATTIDATCMSDGAKDRKCDCGQTQTALIPAKSHNYGDDGFCAVCGENEYGIVAGKCRHKNSRVIEGVAPTCTEYGFSSYTVCGDCDSIVRKAVHLVPAHDWTAYSMCPSCGKVNDGSNDNDNDWNDDLWGDDDNGDDNWENVWGEEEGSTEIVNKDILIQLYENDNNGEFSSGLKRYCAGQDTSGTDEIDTLVRNRNKNAYEYAGVTVKYNYETAYGRGGAVQDIQKLASSGTGSAPDIFANFAYDMTSCALRGCFANLLSNTNKSSTVYGGGANHFAFTKSNYVGVTPDTYFDANGGQGYLYDYMQSLAFVNAAGEYDKIYCLASNYTLDALRSMLVMPVNITMLEGIALEASTGDKDDDGDFDVDDFYSLVWAYDWTYDALATLAEAVYVNDNIAIPGYDIKDTLGLCLAKSSDIPASGVVYTTSVKIINKVVVDGAVTYAYPETNAGLVDLAAALEDLFKNTKGVATLSSEEAKTAGVGNGDLLGIRNRFAEDKVLFGGIVAVGHLEDAVYQQMNEPGKDGFGIVPVPLYTQDANHTEQYNTLVHNLARIFAISKSTTKFEECSAFLDYQSTNSASILEMYYNKTLVAAVESGDAATHNVAMLNYIRNHVRDCFDKTYEDIISNYQGVTDYNSSTKNWHGIFKANGYIVTNMTQRYQEESPAKQAQLEIVLAEWAKLS